MNQSAVELCKTLKFWSLPGCTKCAHIFSKNCTLLPNGFCRFWTWNPCWHKLKSRFNDSGQASHLCKWLCIDKMNPLSHRDLSDVGKSRPALRLLWPSQWRQPNPDCPTGMRARFPRLSNGWNLMIFNSFSTWFVKSVTRLLDNGSIANWSRVPSSTTMLFLISCCCSCSCGGVFGCGNGKCSAGTTEQGGRGGGGGEASRICNCFSCWFNCPGYDNDSDVTTPSFLFSGNWAKNHDHNSQAAGRSSPFLTRSSVSMTPRTLKSSSSSSTALLWRWYGCPWSGSNPTIQRR